MYNCVKCGKKLVDGARFCSYCGVRQAKNPICSKCGTELPADALFCHMCGESVKKAVRPAAVKTASPHLDEAKLTKLTRASVCTSKKGFYSGDENFNLFRIKYFPYMGNLYSAEKYDDHYKIIALSEEQGTEITAAEISTGTLNNVRIAAVNATGIYVIAVLKENEWFKTVIHRLSHSGEMIKSIALDTAENNNLRDMDICGTKIYYRTTSDDYFNVVYVYDAETDERTLAYKSDGQRKILNIVGADNEVYIKVAFTGSFEGEEYTDSGWYVYNISAGDLKCVSSGEFPPSTVLEKPELYAEYTADGEKNPAYVPPEKRDRLNIIAIDVVKQVVWYAEEDKASGKFRIASAPVSDRAEENAEAWEISRDECPFTVSGSGVSVKGYRLFFDGANMYWAAKYYEFYSYLSSGKRSLISSDSKIGEMQHFEVFDKTFYLPDFGAKRTLFHRNSRHHDDTLDMVWHDEDL